MTYTFHEDDDYQELEKIISKLERENTELRRWKESVQRSLEKEEHVQYLNGTADKLAGCSSGACLVEKPIGMHTNGGNCHCSKETLKAKLRKLKYKLLNLKIDWTTNEK